MEIRRKGEMETKAKNAIKGKRKRNKWGTEKKGKRKKWRKAEEAGKKRGKGEEGKGIWGKRGMFTVLLCAHL